MDSVSISGPFCARAEWILQAKRLRKSVSGPRWLPQLIAEPWDVGLADIGWGIFRGGLSGTINFGMMCASSGAANSLLPILPDRLCASASVFNHQGRRPWSSVNFVDGARRFYATMWVAFNEKHNEANGRDIRTGPLTIAHGIGAEGPTEDASINALRDRQMRNLMATLLISQGTPMVLAGDEFGRSNGGNNNALLSGQRDWLGRLVVARNTIIAFSIRQRTDRVPSPLSDFTPQPLF